MHFAALSEQEQRIAIRMAERLSYARNATAADND